MIFTRTIIIFCLISLSVTLNCNQRNVTNIETHLKLTLLCDYERIRVPENEITVNLLFEIEELYPLRDGLMAMVHLMITYNETGLAFDPENYEKISEITVELESIWTPTLYFYDIDNTFKSCRAKCLIQFRGIVMCKYTCFLEMLCTSNFHNWPTENRNCSLSMITINNYGGRIKYDADINVNVNSLEKESSVTVYEVYTPDVKSTIFYPVFGVSIVIEKHANLDFYSIMYPVFAIYVVTLIAFALEFDSLLRISLIAVGIYLELHLVGPINEAFHKRPDQLPNAVIYFRSLFTTSCFLICETLILRGFTTRTVCVPLWFSHLEFLYKFTLFNWHLNSDTDHGPSTFTRNLPATNLKWRIFSTIIDRIFFFIWIISNICVINF